jgi:sulfite reductase alpha subunit-like flavoprotein
MNGASNGNKSNHTNYLTIAFSVVDYITPPMIMKSTLTEMGRRRVRGVATRYLEAISSPLLCSKDDTTQSQSSSHIMDDVAWPSQLQLARIAIPKLRIFPKPTMDFRMPQALSTPLILIGPGTGIAPFIGFLRHRQAVLHQQSNTVVHSKCDDSHGIYSTTVAAKTVVEGTWRGGYELENDNELAISQQDESGLNVGADFRMQSNHAVDYGSVDVLFGCRHQNHDWLYKDEMDAFVQDGIITKLYVAFSRDEPTNTNHRRYVQDIILNDSECGKRFIDLMVHQDAVVYVCGDGNSMAQDVQSAIITLLASSQFQGNRESGKAYLDEMKRKQRFLMDIWS